MKLMSNHISILYPNQDNFNHFDERQEPQIFNYICLHGKQLFITSCNRQYEVVSSGWIPEDSRNITNLEKFKTYHCILRTKQFEIAYMKFFSYVKELVRKSIDYQLELF